MPRPGRPGLALRRALQDGQPLGSFSNGPGRSIPGPRKWPKRSGPGAIGWSRTSGSRLYRHPRPRPPHPRLGKMRRGRAANEPGDYAGRRPTRFFSRSARNPTGGCSREPRGSSSNSGSSLLPGGRFITSTSAARRASFMPRVVSDYFLPGTAIIGDLKPVRSERRCKFSGKLAIFSLIFLKPPQNVGGFPTPDPS